MKWCSTISSQQSAATSQIVHHYYLGITVDKAILAITLYVRLQYKTAEYCTAAWYFHLWITQQHLTQLSCHTDEPQHEYAVRSASLPPVPLVFPPLHHTCLLCETYTTHTDALLERHLAIDHIHHLTTVSSSCLVKSQTTASPPRQIYHKMQGVRWWGWGIEPAVTCFKLHLWSLKIQLQCQFQTSLTM